MEENETKEINNLLQQVSLIVKNYLKIAEITGENYNVFNVLGLKSDELSHSAILANLLNVKGSHGQKDLFLKLFIEVIQDKFCEANFQNSDENLIFNFSKIQKLEEFETEKSKAEKEKHLGRVNIETADGGFIDIYISDGKNSIVIENKIYAGDQDKQLERYSKVDPMAPVFYLNLFGKNATENSAQNLKENIDYYVITYREDITNWLEKCIEKVANKPILRETLNQYLNLIKELTNQSSNNDMKKEIINEIIKSPESFATSMRISNSINEAKLKIWKTFGEILVKELQAKLSNASVVLDENFGKQYKKIRIKNLKFDNRFMHLSFLKDLESPYIEIHPGMNEGKPLKKDFTVVDHLESSLKFFKNRPNIKIEDTRKAWQGEWVVRYNVLNDKYSEIIKNEKYLIEEVTNDLVAIYDAYSNLDQ
jgi:hypothetical protein